jgi:hypothetical protein
VAIIARQSKLMTRARLVEARRDASSLDPKYLSRVFCAHRRFLHLVFSASSIAEAVILTAMPVTAATG